MKIILLSTICLFMCSCAGVKFAEAPVNGDLPDAFSKRALYPAGVSGYEFQDLVGDILLIKKGVDPMRIGVIRPANYKNEVIPITESNNYYKSRIQKGAEAKGSYLAFAADFKADQMAELELIDIARATIAFEHDTIFKQILSQAQTWVAQHPRKDTSVTRVWIKSVVLTRRIYSDFINVGVKASGQVGDVVGVSTGVYNKAENSNKSVLVAFEAFNIDDLVSQASKDSLITPVPSSHVKATTVHMGTIRGTIK